MTLGNMRANGVRTSPRGVSVATATASSFFIKWPYIVVTVT
jgi:hypothetical protein